jgi:prophage tail gpP-like protein
MIELKIGGLIYNGWKTAMISRSLNCMASSFDLTVSDRYIGSKKNIPLDEPCEILIDGNPVISGYLDRIAPQYNASSHEVTFSGRSKTCDLVDCSAIFPTGQILKGTAQSIIEKVCKPFGIKLLFNATDNSQIPDFQIQPGETAQSIIEKVCKRTGLTYTDDAEGNLVIAAVGTGNSIGVLTHKISDGRQNNILEANCEYNSRDCFSEYYVKSQLVGTDELGAENITGVEGSSSDGDVTRYRPLVLTAESAMDAGTAQTRANWEKSNRRAKSMKIECKVQDWRTAAGQLWAPNSYVNIEDEFIRIKGKLIIAAVKLEVGSGTTATLQLAAPEAYIMSSAKQVIKTYQGWKELREGV